MKAITIDDYKIYCISRKEWSDKVSTLHGPLKMQYIEQVDMYATTGRFHLKSLNLNHKQVEDIISQEHPEFDFANDFIHILRKNRQPERFIDKEKKNRVKPDYSIYDTKPEERSKYAPLVWFCIIIILAVLWTGAISEIIKLFR